MKIRQEQFIEFPIPRNRLYQLFRPLKDLVQCNISTNQNTNRRCSFLQIAIIRDNTYILQTNMGVTG